MLAEEPGLNMSEELVLVERDDGVATVTLNRPEALNALSMALRNRIAEVFAELEADETVEAIVLTGAGSLSLDGLIFSDTKEMTPQDG